MANSNLSRLSDIIELLEQLSGQIDQIAANLDPAGLRIFVSHRREIANLFFELSGLANQGISELPADIRQQADADFRSAYSELRKALVNLQADWPMPKISDDLAGYREAKAKFNSIQTTFIVRLRSGLITVLRKVSANFQND